MNLSLIYHFAKERLKSDRSGHDWHHALRVEKNALTISPTNLSTSQIEMIKAAAWLHDTVDPKLAVVHRANMEEIQQLLKNADASPQEIVEILEIVQNLSYSKNLQKQHSLSLVGKIVQDADRLDAIGAIGIARAFYYGGSQKQPLYNDEAPRSIDKLTESNYRQQSSIINHFHEKLLYLEKSMNTKQAQKLAQERTVFMRTFLQHFTEETNYPAQ